MTTQTVVGYFETRADAERALGELERSGIDRRRVRELRDDSGSGPAIWEGDRAPEDRWLDRVMAFLGRARPSTTAGSGRVRGGGIVASVMAADADEADRIAAILERVGAVDVERRESVGGPAVGVAGGRGS